MKKKVKLIMAGNHIDLTPAIKSIIKEKSEKLFNHNENIIRMRVEVAYDQHQSTHNKEYIAKGHLVVKGNDHIAVVASNDLYKSIDQMVLKLDRMIRRRSRTLKTKRRSTNDLNFNSLMPNFSN